MIAAQPRCIALQRPRRSPTTLISALNALSDKSDKSDKSDLLMCLKRQNHGGPVEELLCISRGLRNGKERTQVGEGLGTPLRFIECR